VTSRRRDTSSTSAPDTSAHASTVTRPRSPLTVDCTPGGSGPTAVGSTALTSEPEADPGSTSRRGCSAVRVLPATADTRFSIPRIQTTPSPIGRATERRTAARTPPRAAHIDSTAQPAASPVVRSTSDGQSATWSSARAIPQALAAHVANNASTPAPVARTTVSSWPPKTTARRGPWVRSVLTVPPVNSDPTTSAPSTRASAPVNTGKAAVVLVTTWSGRVLASSWAADSPSVMSLPDPVEYDT
jgi:hypothetical protein